MLKWWSINNKGDCMKKLYMSALLLLAGCVVNNIQAAGTKNPRFQKHFEDQVRDNEMTITDYLDDIMEFRANDSGWRTTVNQLREMANDNRYALLDMRLAPVFDDYRNRRINFSTCQKKIKETIAQVYRGQ